MRRWGIAVIGGLLLATSATPLFVTLTNLTVFAAVRRHESNRQSKVVACS